VRAHLELGRPRLFNAVGRWVTALHAGAGVNGVDGRPHLFGFLAVATADERDWRIPVDAHPGLLCQQQDLAC
jgi:hypothetical protein